MSPEAERSQETTDAADSPSLFRYHLIGWGICALAAVSLPVAVRTTPPPESAAYAWLEPLGERARMRAWSYEVGRTAIALGTGGLVLAVAATMVIRAGLSLANLVRRRPE